MRHKLLMFCLALIAGAGTVFAESGTCGKDGDNLTWELTDSVLTISGTGAMKDWANSSSNTAPWFGKRTKITSVVINEGVTSIGEYAFHSHAKIRSAEISNTVTSIGTYAFGDCTALTSINIPASVTNITVFAFINDKSLTDITVDADNPNYSSVDGVLFNKEQTKLILHPAGSTRTQYTVPDGVTVIETHAFRKCANLTSITLPDNLTKFGSSTFAGCTGLTSITLPNSLTNLGSSTFEDCTGLTSIEIPEGITAIGDYVFDGCTALTSVTIPGSVTSIGKYVFNDCKKLASIEIPEDVNSIGNYAFANCSTLVAVVIPEKVTSIGNSTFYRCAALTSVTMGDSVTSIGQDVFSGCQKLTSIQIPETVTSIGKYAFASCTALKSIVLPKGIKNIQESTFSGCKALISIDIPNSATYIYKAAFSLCTGLTSVTIGTGVTGLAESAFSNCTGLTSITCKALTPPSCGSLYCFNNVDKSIPLYVPEASITAYRTSRWNSFTNILPLTSNISVTIPTDVPNGYYENMILELHKLNTQFVEKRSVLNKREFLFGRVPQGSEYQVFLKNAYGQVMGQTEKVNLGDEDLALTIDKLLRTKDVSLKVTTPDKKEITDKVTILWADTANNAIGHTSRLKAVAEGAKLTCKVTLPNQLALQYIAPAAMQLTVDAEAENLLTIQLQPVQQLTLHGVVKDQKTGATVAGASVALTQQLGGNDGQSVIATTDKDGKYELQGTNVQGVLSVTAPGYLPKTIEFNAPDEEGTLPAVELEQFNGIIVSTWLTYTEAAKDGEESKVTEGYEGNGDLAYKVYNQSKDVAIENVIIKDNLLYLPSNVKTGDKLKVTVSSRSNDFSPVSAVCEITKNTMGSVTLPLIQRGCINATVPNDKSDSVMAILYNADGRFVRHSPYRINGISFAGLTAGDYSLITMTTNPLLRNVLLQSTFGDMGLVEGTDYAKNAVHVEDGKITTVNVPNVPALDMDKLHFTDSSTYFIADKNVINVGQYYIIIGRANFTEQYTGRISDMEFVVDVPEEIEVLANLAYCNGDACNYRVEDGHYIFQADQVGKYSLVCSMKPTQPGEFRISGAVRFTLDGVKMVQPIGTTWLQANGFAMNTPMFHTSSTLCVSGTAPVNYNGYAVEIYDYDKLIGTTTVMANGKWAANIQLPSNGKYDVHAVKARIIMPEVGVVESEVKNVAYNSSAKMAKKVVMINQKKERITFNYFDKHAGPPHYSYILEETWYGFLRKKTPYTTEFTFLAYFDEADLSEGGDVKISVLASDGTTRTMDAAYDGKQHCYYATTDYPHYTKIPVSAYAFTQATYAPISEEDQDAMWEEKAQALAKLTQATLHAVETTGELEILPGDDETLNMKYSVAEKDSFLISMKEMDYDEASAYAFENGPLIYSGEEGNIVYTFVEGENESVMVLLDVDEHYALRMVITFDGTNEQEANAGKRYVGPNNISVAGAWSGLMGAGSGLLTALGLWDWINGIPEAYEFNVRRAKHTEDINNHIIIFNWILNWKCDCGKNPDKPRFSIQDRITYTEREVALLEQNEAFMQRLQAYSNQTVEATCKKMVADIISMLAGAGAGKAIAKGAATKLGPAALAKLEKAAALLESDGGKVTASTLGFVKDLLKSGLLGNQSFDQWIGADFRSLLKQMMAMIDGEGQAIINGFDALEKDMAVDNDNCFEEEECEGDDCDPEECEGGDCIPEDECEGEDCEDECEGDDCDPGDECEGDDCDPGEGGGEECEGEDCEDECEGEDCEDECEGEDCEDECEGEDCKKKEPKDDKFPPGYPFPDPATVCLDPSGFIYEAVLSNRVEGATVTLYYAVSEGQDAMWDADNYGQINPQITGADGKYQWDVPEGSWQVRVQKEGYQTAITDWLPVPPPQLDVNIPLVRNKQPEVKSAHAYEDAVTVKFDSYMKPADLTTEMITVKENGNAVEGTITLTNEEAAPGGATYASQIRFVPATPFSANEVTLLISGEVKNYADIEMGEPYEAILSIEKELKGLKADKTVKIEYGSTGVLHVKGTPAVAAAGKTVTVQCESGIFASTTQTTVVLNEKGEADVTIQGDLPGTEYVTFTLTETEQTAITRVKVVTHLEVLEAPTASIPTGSEVEKATPVTLSCQTEGAKIYYTLDGSNPRNSGTRVLYDGTPIVIFEETTLKAVAFYDGKGQSEMITYHYTIKVATAITDVINSNITVTPVRVHDSFEVNGVDGTFSVSVFSMTGKQLIVLGQVTSGQKVKATALQTGVYLVVVNGEDAYFTQRIIKD